MLPLRLIDEVGGGTQLSLYAGLNIPFQEGEQPIVFMFFQNRPI